MKNKRVKNPEPETSLDKNHILCILAGLTVVGALLRFYQLGFNSLWLDEISTFNYASGTLQQMWGTMATGTDYTPPLFFLFEKISLLIFGAGEWQMRLFPAIFGVATIPVMYYIGKEFWDEQVGLVAAGFIAFSPFLIFYSQEARSYSLVLLLCAIEFYFLAKAVQNDRNDYWIFFGLFAGLALWTHFYSIIFTAALMLYVIYKCWHYKNSVPFIISVATFTIVTLPIIISLFSLFRQRTTSDPTYGFKGIDIIYATVVQIGGYNTVISEFLVVLGICGLVYLYTKDKNRFATLALLVIVTLIASIFLSYKIPMIPRYLIFLAIPLSLGIAMVSTMIPKRFAKKTIIASFLIAFFVLAIPFYATNYTNYSKDDWRTVATELKVMTVVGDSVITVPTYIDMPVKYYYDAGADGTTIHGVMNASDLVNLQSVATGTKWYIVTGDIRAADPSGKSLAWLLDNTTVVRSYGSVVVLRGK